MNRLPEIIAHRGASQEALENTLEAFEIALNQEADGLELDVHATRDGVVVVHHDPVLRLPDGATAAIADLDAAQALAVPLRGDARLPALDAVLDLAGTRATVYVEVKATAIEDALSACLARHPASRVAVHAFDHRIPVAMRRRRPGLPIGLLSASYPLSVEGFVGSARPDAFWQQAQLIDQALVDACHTLGMRVIAWTENDPVHARSLIAMGVDALCTDTPGLLRRQLRR